MTNKVEELREELRNLSAGHLRGDVPRRKFDRLRAEKSVALYRAIVTTQLAKDEKILEEHHVVRAHLKLSQSVLKEPAEEVISLFLTDQRVLRLRSVLDPGQIVAGDASDHTVVDGARLGDIADLRVRRELRLSEAIAGLIICAVAVLFRSWLLVTGTFLFVIGLAGILHALLMPTRWMEIEVLLPRTDDIIRIYGLRKKSARKLLRALRERMIAFPETAEEN
jgi:hypothetical protein